MHIFVINSGSSSLKFRLYAMGCETLRLSDRMERIDEPGSRSPVDPMAAILSSNLENIILPMYYQ